MPSRRPIEEPAIAKGWVGLVTWSGALVGRPMTANARWSDSKRRGLETPRRVVHEITGERMQGRFQAWNCGALAAVRFNRAEAESLRWRQIRISNYGV
jgi:hypothetical protein